LRAPRGESTRPTSDRVKEAIFNILGAPPTSARALDLYAGSGALGLEALSRGCAEAVFVERSEPALTALRQNVKELGLEGRARISSGEALREAARMSRHGERFGWIFLDPPYAAGVLEQALSAVAPLCAEDTTVIAEHDVHHEPEAAVGPLSRSDRRRYGDTCVSFYRSEREAA
jgi:16S rRNA (guanine(966)-N(2))-methyltransferase RsmD